MVSYLLFRVYDVSPCHYLSFFFFNSIYVFDGTLIILAVKVITPIRGLKSTFWPRWPLFHLLMDYTFFPLSPRIHHCLVCWDTLFLKQWHKFSLQIEADEMKKISKKGKTFHKKKQKKSLPLMCSCIKFTLFFMSENSMSMCHTDFFFFLFYGC